MNDVSNSTLALFVVLAIVVSVFGTFMSLSKLDQMTGVGITGFASADGKANLSVRSSSNIQLLDDLVELGALNINDTNSSETKDDYFIIQNDGSDPIDIDIYGLQSDGSTHDDEPGAGPFVSPTLYVSTETGCWNATGDGNHTCFMVRCVNVSGSGACTNECTGLWSSEEGSCGNYTALPLAIGVTFINEIPIAAGSDRAWVGVNVTVPLGEPSATTLDQTVSFEASVD